MSISVDETRRIPYILRSKDQKVSNGDEMKDRNWWDRIKTGVNLVDQIVLKKNAQILYVFVRYGV